MKTPAAFFTPLIGTAVRSFETDTGGRAAKGLEQAHFLTPLTATQFTNAGIVKFGVSSRHDSSTGRTAAGEHRSTTRCGRVQARSLAKWIFTTPCKRVSFQRCPRPAA